MHVIANQMILVLSVYADLGLLLGITQQQAHFFVFISDKRQGFTLAAFPFFDVPEEYNFFDNSIK